MIDLRSDTVTKPSAAMRRAMHDAEVGDDVYQEDPTVNRLEERAAEAAGKEAALFVPTGSMGNTIGVKLHTRHGQEVVCEARSHVFNYELAMMAWFSGCVARPVHAGDGAPRWAAIRAAVKPLSPHWAPAGLVCIENSHNMAGGTVTPAEAVDEICDGAHGLGLAVHMDGARVFNAAASLGVTVKRLVERVDTVMFCLSKGLGAPVGSMLAGSKAAMDEARLLRKRLGGGMRQAGVLAAAGLIALEEGPKRLHEDHANARLLAEGLAGIPGVAIDPARVHTNIVIFDVAGAGLSAADFVARVKERGVLCGAVSPSAVRFVTHLDVDAAQCRAAVVASAAVAGAAR